jgi:acyl-CoA thioesterase-1
VYARRTALVAVSFFLLLAPLFGAERPVLVCFGDSITAGHGLSPDEAFPAQLQKKLDLAGYSYQVVNRGTSGATTKDAVASLPYVIRLHPAVVIVEFGGNDGLRGLPVEQTRANLDRIVASLEQAHIAVLIAGITLPPDYGPDYIHAFEKIFPAVASAHHAALLPMLYKNLVGVPGVIQPDGIHPTAKGSAIIADTLLPALKPLLHK